MHEAAIRGTTHAAHASGHARAGGLGLLLRAEPARALAALRISVTALVLASPETYSATQIAALPRVLLRAPEGLGWALATLPLTPGVARALEAVLVLSALSGLLGWRSRLSLGLVTMSGLYVFGAYQLTGQVTHDMHLLWFSALLALGPCGDAWSVDRWLAARRGAAAAGPSLGTGVTLLFARALLGLVYFFPGFWKLRESGLAWITSDNLENQMHAKWYENGVVPALRVDRWGAMLHAGALGVVLLELSFVLLALVPRTRLVAALGGLAFHLAAQAFLLIPFVSLWGCYTMLLPWRGEAPAQRGAWDARTRATFALGSVLVALVVVQGARGQMQAWPFACYPTFQYAAAPTLPDLVMEAVLADGSTRLLPDGPGAGGARSPAGWATAWDVAGAYGAPVTEARLRAYLATARWKPGMDAALAGAVRLRFYRATYSTDPDDARKPPVAATPIGEIALP